MSDATCNRHARKRCAGCIKEEQDRSYWLREFAGRAMQGYVANGDGMTREVLATCSVQQAVALLNAIEAHEKEVSGVE